MTGAGATRPGRKRRRPSRRAALAVWRRLNPLVLPLAGGRAAPWWVVLETTGRASGRPRRVPLARGPVDGGGTWLIAVHGRRATWVRNLEARPAVRLRLGGRWRPGRARVLEWDPALARRFSRYARAGPAGVGRDPAIVRVDWDAA